MTKRNKGNRNVNTNNTVVESTETVIEQTEQATLAEHVEAEPIDPTEDTVADEGLVVGQSSDELRENDVAHATTEGPTEYDMASVGEDYHVTDGDEVVNHDPDEPPLVEEPELGADEVLVGEPETDHLAAELAEEVMAAGGVQEHIEQVKAGASTQAAWDALLAQTRQEVPPTPEKAWNDLTDEEREAALAANAPKEEPEFVEETVVEKTTEPEMTMREAEENAKAFLADQEALQETKGEAPVEPEVKVKGGTVAKRWMAGTVKDGRKTLFGKDFADHPDSLEFSIMIKENPKRGQSAKRLNTILLRKCKTAGEYRKLWGTKLANDDFAWDHNHDFYRLKEPATATVVRENADPVAA